MPQSRPPGSRILPIGSQQDRIAEMPEAKDKLINEGLHISARTDVKGQQLHAGS